jgi:L-fucose isomerase-like protein
MKMSITKANDVKLKVLPLSCTAEHLYYYEGPCRFGSGETLMPGYDRLANAQREKKFMDNLKACVSDKIEIMELAHLGRTDDWDNHEAQWEAIKPLADECDAVVVLASIASDDLAVEFGTRFKKPMIVSPDALASHTLIPAALHSTSDMDHEVFGAFKWEQVARYLNTMRARKVIRTTRILLATRFGNPTSYSSVDSFNSYEKITSKLGVRFRFVNIHELLDQMTPAVEGGNPTTPGRKTLDLTDEDLAEANRITDELIAGAESSNMDRDMLLKSVIAYVTVKKNMDEKDCCGFTAPCPDVCSTRRLNQMQFTFCLTHSLNLEQGIPSCCEFDVDGVLSMQALIAVSGKCPYVGNTSPVIFQEDGTAAALGSSVGQVNKLKALKPGNMYLMQHSVGHRRIKDEKKDSPYQIRNFAIDQKFGATIRYDFDGDAGREMTLCRFSPDGEKLFIAPAEVLLGDGYDAVNCAQVVYFRVRNDEDFFAKQCYVGNHLTMVYGNYVRELVDLAKSMGVEPIVAD